ncbi:MAG: dipeptidase [Elusimicrobia bacterium]|nr:dipeptidase [Elusimicrobiota bacterium]
MAATLLAQDKKEAAGQMVSAASYVQANFDRFLAELVDWLKIPSISSSSQHKTDVVRAINYGAGLLEKLGFKTETLQTKGHPSLYAEKIVSATAPTVLIYGHLDVQPVDPLDQWKTPPFEPRREGDRLWGRGTADDKGQVMIHFKACETLIKTKGELPVNIKFIVEGEEEIGSPNFEQLVSNYKDKLKSDVALVSDTAMVAENCPTISYATRGLVYFEVSVEGPKIDLHSGQFGGAVLNPALALSQILTAMVDKNGKVTIPGFYKDVANPTAEEKRWFKRAERLQNKELAFVAGVPLAGGEKGKGLIERVWARPTFEVHGLISGFQGEGSKTIIPQRASAKVSVRLVPKQDPAKITNAFKRHVAKLTPKGVKVTVKTFQGGGPAFLENPKTPVFLAAKQALKEVFKTEPYYERCGGSIFAPELFKKVFPATPVVMLGFGLPGENAHAPNEWLSLDNFRRGILTCARYYELLPVALIGTDTNF